MLTGMPAIAMCRLDGAVVAGAAAAAATSASSRGSAATAAFGNPNKESSQAKRAMQSL